MRIEQREALQYVALPVELEMDQAGERIPAAYDQLGQYLASRGIEPTGPSVVRYRLGRFDKPFMIEVGWILEDGPWIDAPFVADVLPAGTYVVGTHSGPYALLSETTGLTMAWGDAQGVDYDFARTDDGDLWTSWYEYYVDEPIYGPDGPGGTVEICLLTRA